MGSSQQALIGISSGVIYTAWGGTWSTTDKSSHISLSGSNLVATDDGVNGGIRSSTSKTGGPVRAELTCGAISPMIGLALGTVDLTTAVWNQTGTFFYYRDGQKYIDGTNTNYGASYTTNDVIGLQWAPNGDLIMTKNGASQGVLASGVSGTYYICFCRGGGSPIITANFSGSFTYPTV